MSKPVREEILIRKIPVRVSPWPGLFGLAGSVVFLMSLCLGARGSQSLSVAWDANPDPSVAGYAVYYGSASHVYSTRVNVGTNTFVTIPGLTEGQTNFVAVASYNAAGVEGPASAEVLLMVPGVLRAAVPAGGNPMGLNFPVAPGHWYEIQATADLKSWATIWQTAVFTSNTWVNYQDPQANAYARRYYRLILH